MLRRTTKQPRPRGFSLIELVIVVVIIGIVAAIAIPAMSGASERAKAAVVRAGVSEIDGAIERYKGDHDGRSPAHDVDGSINYDVGLVRERLTMASDAQGEIIRDGTVGGYLKFMPKNPFSSCDWLRVDDQSTRHGCSWLFDPISGAVRADHMPNLWHDGESH